MKKTLVIVGLLLLCGAVAGYYINSNKSLTINLPQNENSTINPQVQKICEKELNSVLEKTNAKKGITLVLNSKNGEILGFSAKSLKGDVKNYEIEDWALNGSLQGSLFKPVIIASALELNKITNDTKIKDSGKIKIGFWDIKNYDYSKNPTPGLVDLTYLIKHSSNVGAIKIAQMMANDELYNQLKAFGFGEKTNLGLEQEKTVKLPVLKNQNEVAATAIGYNVLATPLQITTFYSAIANNGEWIAPHLTKTSQIEKKQILTKENAKIMNSILKDASLDNEITIKSATARHRQLLGGYSNELSTSAIGIGAAKNEKLVVYVMVDSPKADSIWGSTIAAPVIKNIFKELKI